MGETRVDLLHLLEDLRDAYPASLEETIIGEIVANALDSGATAVALDTTSAPNSLTVCDNGNGMTRRELARYHDLAASAKTRGRTIGFAGVGIKLGLLACEEVFTETRRGPTHVATRWRLASRHRAPWSWVEPAGLIETPPRGTAVRLHVVNPLSPLLDPAFIAATLARHYEPLIDPLFGPALASRYRSGVTLLVNGSPLVAPAPLATGRATLAARLGRQRRPAAFGYLTRSADPFPEGRRGLAISTLGKVILRGWDWLGIVPTHADRVGGLVEAPALAAALTLNKGDFIRVGKRGALYLAYRKALQEAVGAQLAAWGDAPDTRSLERKSRVLERDLERVLAELADEFPLVATLVDWRRGGQRRMALGAGTAATRFGPVTETVGAEQASPPPPTPPTPESVTANAAEPAPPVPDVAQAGGGPKRPAHTGLSIRFETGREDAALGRLVESTVWVNDAHPAYRRAVATHAESYHIALTVGMTLAPLAADGAAIQNFVTTFLARWGETNGQRRRRGRR